MQSAPPPQPSIVCPTCQAPATLDAKRCLACRVTLRIGPRGMLEEEFPDVRPGEPIRLMVFPRDPLPGGYRSATTATYTMTPVPNGTMILFNEPIGVPLPDRTVRLRDGCVKATMTPVDTGLNIGLSARVEDLETKGAANSSHADTCYAARLYPDTRRAILSRQLVFDDRKRIGTSVVREATNVVIPPLGTPITLELLVEGPTLVFMMNGQVLLKAHDLTYGIGYFGLRVTRDAPKDGTQRRIVIHDFAMAMVSR